MATKKIAHTFRFKPATLDALRAVAAQDDRSLNKTAERVLQAWLAAWLAQRLKAEQPAAH